MPAGTPTTRLGLPSPDSADAADVPADIYALALALDKAAIISQGTLASRPTSSGGTPGINGRYYLVRGDAVAANNNVLWYDYGTGWIPINKPTTDGTEYLAFPAGNNVDGVLSRSELIGPMYVYQTADIAPNAEATLTVYGLPNTSWANTRSVFGHLGDQVTGYAHEQSWRVEFPTATTIELVFRNNGTVNSRANWTGFMIATTAHAYDQFTD